MMEMCSCVLEEWWRCVHAYLRNDGDVFMRTWEMMEMGLCVLEEWWRCVYAYLRNDGDGFMRTWEMMENCLCVLEKWWRCVHAYLRNDGDVFMRTWGMMEMCLRRSWRPISCTLMPSMVIFPVGSTRRNSIVISELFPAPVLPTIPTCRKTGFRLFSYLLSLFWYFITYHASPWLERGR